MNEHDKRIIQRVLNECEAVVQTGEQLSIQSVLNASADALDSSEVANALIECSEQIELIRFMNDEQDTVMKINDKLCELQKVLQSRML